MSGGLDGIVALYDLDGMNSDKTNSKRQSVKSISTSCNTVDAGSQTRTITQPQAQRVPTLSVAISSVNWYPEDSGLFATTDFDGNLNIWDTNEFTVVGNFKLRSKIYNSKFKADGSLIAVALDDHSIRCIIVSTSISSATSESSTGFSDEDVPILPPITPATAPLVIKNLPVASAVETSLWRTSMFIEVSFSLHCIFEK